MSDLISRQKAKDAIDMALDHIDHVPSWVYDNLLNALNEVPSVKPTHSTPSNALGALDCVDRKAMLDILSQYPFEKVVNCLSILKELPSVQPERKTGQWICQADDDIWNCSECDYEIDGTGCIDPLEYLKTYKFCPNCGSYNGGEQTE